MNLSINQEKLLLYQISYNELYRVLRTAFKENSVAMLHSYQQYLPISIAGDEKTVNQVLQETLIQTQPDSKTGEVNFIPLRELIKVTPAEDLKSITAGRNGEYIPYKFYGVENAEKLMTQVKETSSETGDWDIAFSGSFFPIRRCWTNWWSFCSSPFADVFHFGGSVREFHAAFAGVDGNTD